MAVSVLVSFIFDIRDISFRRLAVAGRVTDIAFTQKRDSADSGRRRPPRSAILGLCRTDSGRRPPALVFVRCPHRQAQWINSGRVAE